MRKKILTLLIFLPLFFICFANIYAAQTQSDYVKAEVVSTTETVTAAGKRIQKLKVLILSGKYKGLIPPVDNYLWQYEGYNMPLAKGDKFTLKVVEDYDGSLDFLVMGRYRSPYIYVAAILFVVLFFIVAGFKRKASLLMIAFNFFIVLPLLFFIIKSGFNPLAAGLIICGVSIFISVSVVLGSRKKIYSAAAGSLLGVVLSGILTMVFLDFMKIEGKFTAEARMILVASRYLSGWQVTDLKGIVAAGIMVASLGAVIDIAVSIVSASSQVYLESRKTAGPAKLFKSGLNIGRDMVATMLNSLVLVFTGLALPVLMVFRLMEIPFIKVINFEFFLIFILSAVISSIALMVTVPITSYITSKVIPDA